MYKSFMFGVKALPDVGELAKQVDNIIPSTRVVPFVAPISAAPYVTNNICQVARTIDRVVPIGKFGDVSSSSIYIAADNILNQHPNPKRFVGDSLGGSIVLELQKYPEVINQDIWNANYVSNRQATTCSEVS